MEKERHTINIPEKGTVEDVEHALLCTEQAEKRADKDWIRKACACRREMLMRQLARMKERI